MFVYFVQEEQTRNFKIGKADNVYKRLAQLQTGNSSSLILRLMIRGDEPLEKSLHRRFKEFRIRGEWFKPCQEIESYIKLKQINPEINLDAVGESKNPICIVCSKKFEDNDLVQGQINKYVNGVYCRIEPNTYIYCCGGGKSIVCSRTTKYMMDRLYEDNWGWDIIKSLKRK